MPHFTMRLTWPDDPERTEDFVFLVDGKERGRCYRHWVPNPNAKHPAMVQRWKWTVYSSVENGNEDTLEQAQAAFKRVIGGGNG
jgi:hypothetical protein